jgi:hypothetical protein
MEKRAALVPLPCVHLVRYAGCLGALTRWAGCCAPGNYRVVHGTHQLSYVSPEAEGVAQCDTDHTYAGRRKQATHAWLTWLK